LGKLYLDWDLEARSSSILEEALEALEATLLLMIVQKDIEVKL
jgi:hypothetical protein